MLVNLRDSVVLLFAYVTSGIAESVNGVSSTTVSIFNTLGSVNENDLIADSIYSAFAAASVFSEGLLQGSESIITEVEQEGFLFERIRVPRQFNSDGTFSPYGSGNILPDEQATAERKAALIIRKWLLKRGDQMRALKSYVDIKENNVPAK